MSASTIARAVTLVAAAASLAACSKAQARTPPPAPELTVPAPPSRVVIPVTVKVPVPPPPDVVEAEPARPPAAAGTPPSRPPDRPATTPPPTQPPPVLQTTANQAAIEGRVRDMVGSARRDLARVDRSKLAANARDQFDTAERFIRMAEEAIDAKNLLYAQQLAESAAALAGRLVKGEPAAAIGL